MSNTTQPFKVTAPDGKVRLLVMDATKDSLPSAFALMGTRAQKKVAVRLLGGCKGMSAADKAEMIRFFSDALTGYRGLIWSGGTRAVKDGVVDPMVTDVPGIIAAENPGSVALGTCPRTDMLTLQEDSRLVLDEYGTAPNPDMYGILIVQNGPEEKAEWDLDVPTYLSLMDQWKTYSGFTAVGTVAWNGGAVTEKEILASAKRGWPTILVSGSGRVTDELATKFCAGDKDLLAQLPKNHRLAVVSKDDASALRQVLREYGFLAQEN